VIFLAKRIAVLNDLSGFGRCSLSAAISVISALGVQPCPIPTAVLSNQTCFESFYIKDLTSSMEKITEKWQELGFLVDGIYSGFLSDEKQADAVLKLCDIYKEAIFILDPVLGDENVPYANFTPELLSKMNMLLKKAHIITPNITELCILSNAQYTTDIETIKEMVLTLSSLPENRLKAIVVTGIENGENIENLIFENGSFYTVSVKKIGSNFSGTGDITASIISAYAVNGKSVVQAVKKSSEFISKCIADTILLGIDPQHGIEFEKNLSMLSEIY
jgi:pyridoxine kinase